MQFVIAFAMLAISYAITALTAKKPQVAPPSPFKDIKFPIPAEGTPQAIVFGDVWLSDWQVLWVGNYHTESISSSSGGKKG